MKNVKTLSLLALLTALILPLSGTDIPEKDIILITEERQKAESDAGQKTLIQKENWERKGARTVAEAIDLTAGVTVSQTGTALESSTVSIRGAGGEQILVMIDGIPLNNGKGDPVNLNTLSLNNVITIEVIRGGNSAVYGEGAFGGAVNLVTSQDPVLYSEADIYFKAGSFNAYTGGASFKLPLNPMGTLTSEISGEYRSMDGDYDYESSTGSTTRSNSSGWADNAAAGIDWNMGGMDRHRLSLNFSWYNGKRGVPGLMEFLTPEAELEESRLNLSSRYRFTGYTGFTMDTEYSYIQQDSYYTNPEKSSEDEHDNSSFRGRLDLRDTIERGSWTFTPLLGGIYSRDSLTSTSLQSSNGTTLPGEADQDSGSIYSRIALSNEDLSITPAFRWDYNTTEYAGWEGSSDNHSSWSLTMTYTLPSYQNLSFKGNIGTAYHSPGFDDLFWSGGSFASGNPDLLPEESFNWDGGITLRPFKGLEISSVYYQVATENLIQWLPTASGTWSPSNIGKVDGQGMENAVSWLIPLNQKKILFLDIGGSYSWMRMQEKTENSINNGNQLPYRPAHSASGAFSFIINKHSLTFSANYMGQRFTNMANTKDLDPLLTCNSTLKLVFDSGVYTSFSLLNMGDVDYVDKLGYPVPGREWSITGGYRF